MEAWERVWGRLDEDRTRGEVLRKPHGHSWTSYGRATHICGRVIFAESKHGQDGNPTWPCDPGHVGSLNFDLMIRRVLTHTGNWVSHTTVWPARVSREILVFQPISSHK
ncbi:unnamed protein product [Linum trigynum]|uniref:Uncharacterized protein n=1 Tax=Linum trigynum TaxID=586398 RepID=A0AAV2D5S1_9ROSI